MAAKERPPQVKRDGRCLQCDGERPPVAVTERDPFCSTACSKAWHGVDYAANYA